MFILAAAGSAVGLGNVWKYPYIAGENGGAAFTLVYLACVAIIGLPLLIGEFLLGQVSEKSPVGAYRRFGGRDSWWPLVGGLGVFTGFLVLSFYSVVAGWAMAYVVKAVQGEFSVMVDSQVAADIFGRFSSNLWGPLFWHFLFMAITIWVVVLGVKSGLEKCNKVLMPALLVILLMLLVRSLTLPGAGAGVRFLWQPDFSKLSWEAVLLALGHAFFTLSLGMGVGITYGSYLKTNVNVPKAALWIALLDTGIALLAGLVIFPAVFATGGEVKAGPSLIFETLPVVFNHLPFGTFFGFCFFVFLSMAALTSAISMLEVVAAYFVDERQWSRRWAAIIPGVIIFILGIPCSLSFGLLQSFQLSGRTVFDWFDYLASNLCLPIGGLLLAVFVGWQWKSSVSFFFAKSSLPFFVAKVWHFIVRWLAPILVIVILLAKFLGIV